MSADLIALLDSNPAAGILATANLREERASATAGGGSWHLHETDDGHEIRLADSGAYESQYTDICYGHGLDERDEDQWDLAVLIAEHIAAEANPAHALAAVRRWRGVVERHIPVDGRDRPESACFACRNNGPWTQCPELAETADEARAYLGEAS